MTEVIKKIIKTSWDVLETTAFALGIFVACYLFLFQTQQVMGMSSYPTLKPDEKLIVEKVSYRFHEPARGDFVILESPNNSEVDFVKRIVGLPGERFKILGGKVYINGQLLEQVFLDPSVYTGPESFLLENQEITIPPDYYFVMGDNRSQSSDSRDFGPVPKRKIVGRVFARFWPLDRAVIF